MVGAGPGDAGLLTLRGAELLALADVIIYDQLVNPDLLRLAPQAELIHRGKGMTMPQADITALILAKAREGKTVVRLKGGDPYIFGRGGEEAEALATAKIHFEVVPGVSSVVAAPNYAGIPLTHRDHCSSFTVFTGHAEAAETKTDLRYEQIAKIPGTKVVLMGMERLAEWTRSLIAHGMAAETPVAVVEQGTTGRQRSVAGTLATITALVAEKKIAPPALTILGDVVKLRGKLNWFEQQPLFGQRIVVTRRAGKDAATTSVKFGDGNMPSLPHQLAVRGADVLEIPTIKTVPPTNLAPIADALIELNSYDWLVFTSPTGVTKFFEIFFRGFDDMRDIGGVRIAAVGPATAAKLKEFHLKVNVMPEEFIGVKIAAAMNKYESVENLKICLLRAEVATPELPKALEALGGIVDDIPCYKTVPETEDPTGAAARLLEAGADWITFTSSSTVENFHVRFDLPALLKKFPQTRLASIGPETSKALTALGLKPAVEAKAHTIEGLVAALEKNR